MENLATRIESRFLPFVEKPMRYAGGELNMVRKDESGIAVHGVLCFPDLYDIGMSHHGLQILYHMVNRTPQWALSRCFHPWTDAEKLLRDLEIPLFSLEYRTPIRDADWIGFSVQYELQYTNLVNMLDLAGLEIYSEKRLPTDPLIVAGGPCMGNPEPIASFVDACVIGDGEEVVVAICSCIEESKRTGSSRAQVLQTLDAMPGVYVPRLHPAIRSGIFDTAVSRKAVSAAKISHLDDTHYPDKPVVPLMDVVHHRLAVEVMRGCTRGCRFCSAGIYYRPLRERSPESVYHQIRNGVEGTGWRDVGLLSLSTSDYTCLPELLQASIALRDQYQIDISLPSTRIDSLSSEQLDNLDRVSPASSFTIAPEAASLRLRRVINKDFTDDAIYDGARRLLERNVQTLKLYFMIGLPTETAEDIEAIVHMVTKLADMAWSISKRKSINVSISPFSPKAHTPFQWEAMEDAAILQDKGRYIKQSLRNKRNVKVSYRNADMTFLETIMARGDRAAGNLVYEAWKAGARFDGWEEHFNIQRWRTAAEIARVDVFAYVKEIPQTQALPWAVIDTGVSHRFLEEERERSRAETATPDCRTGICSDCGACHSGRTCVYAVAVADVPIPQNTTNGITAGASVTYRFFYRKEGSVRFLGHLDMARVFHRAFLAAGYPLSYSKGFHPHPRVAFGPPLPFGLESREEAVDVTMTASLRTDPLHVNHWLPPGLKVTSAIIAGRCGVASLSTAIIAARYRFEPLEKLTSDYMQLRARDILGKNEIPISIIKNGNSKTKDLRPLIIGIEVGGTDDCLWWDTVLKLEPGATCKPSELISMLCCGKTLSDFRASRISCLVRTGPELQSILTASATINYGRRV